MGLRRIFSRSSAPTVLAIEDRPWNNPALDATIGALPQLPPAEAVEAALAHVRPLRHRTEDHVQAVQALGDRLIPALDVLRGQCAAATDDDRDAADRLALLGFALIDHAWEIRGGTPAENVSQSSWSPFRSLLEEADETLQEALARIPDHPAAATARLTTALGLGAPSQQWWERFETARQVRTTLYPAHWSMLSGLCRKWYGSDELMFDFGRSVAANAPTGDPVSAMLPLAHAEYLCSLVMNDAVADSTVNAVAARQRAMDLDAVAAASYRWCGDGTAPAPAHPCQVKAHNVFGWFLGITDEHRDRGRWHLEQTGHRMSSAPWNYLAPDPVRAFQDLHARLGIA